MISYNVLSEAENSVLTALLREGGELSLPELTNLTQLPSGIVQSVVTQLVHKNSVDVDEQPGTGLRLIHLRKAPSVMQHIRQLTANLFHG